MDYKNGKIYKIVSDLTEMIYIGATTQPLYKRFNHHKTTFKTGKKMCKSVEIIKLGETRIELIEDFPCERKEQLNAREGYYIRLNKNICVNRCIIGRTKQEYNEDNKEYLTKIKKQWYENNKIKYKAQKAENSKKYYESNKEKIKQYTEANKDAIKERLKQYREANKDAINERQKQYTEANKDAIKERRKVQREINKDTIKEQKKAYYEANKEVINERRKQKRQSNKDVIQD